MLTMKKPVWMEKWRIGTKGRQMDQWVVSTEGSWLPGKGRKGKREGEAKEKGKTGRKDVWKEKNGWIGRMEE